MKFNYTTFKLANQMLGPDDNDAQQVFVVGSLTIYCALHFDTDKASSTYNHWICCLDVVSDTEDIPERSLTVYPNTIHFEGDDKYTVVIRSELEEIGHDDLVNTLIIIGVPVNE